jgi:hypothetical protein
MAPAGIAKLAERLFSHRWWPVATSVVSMLLFRYVALAVIALAAIVTALPLALVDAANTGTGTNISKFAVREIVYATTAFFVLLSCAALWPWNRKDGQP